MKEQGLTETLGSQVLAVVWAVIDRIERDALESDRDPGGYVFYSSELRDYLNGFARGVPGRIVVYMAPFNGESGEEVDIGGKTRIVFDRLEGDGMSYRELMNSAYKVPFIYDSHLLRSYASKTNTTGVEYMFLYLSDSRLAYLEGEHFHVSIPFIESAIASLHTHPESSCMLSHADVESGIDALVNGSIMTGAVTSRCAVLLRRTGLLTENDFIELKKFAGFLRRRNIDRRLLETRVYELNKKLANAILEVLYY